jgi:hypothetical protein
MAPVKILYGDYIFFLNTYKPNGLLKKMVCCAHKIINNDYQKYKKKIQWNLQKIYEHAVFLFNFLNDSFIRSINNGWLGLCWE